MNINLRAAVVLTLLVGSAAACAQTPWVNQDTVEDHGCQIPAAVGNGEASNSAQTLPKNIVELRDVRDLALSPDGSTVAFQIHRADTAKNSYCSEWLLVRTKDGHTIDIGDGGEPAWDFVGQWQRTEPTWDEHSGVFLYLRMKNGHTQLWRTSVADTRTEPVYAADRDVRSFSWAPDHQSILMETGPSDETLRSELLKLRREGVVSDDSFEESIAPVSTERDLIPKLSAQSTYIALTDRGAIRPATAEEIEYLRLNATNPYQRQKSSPDGAVVASIEDVPGPSGDRFNRYAIFLKRRGMGKNQLTSVSQAQPFVVQHWWAPTGTDIVFLSSGDGTARINRVNAVTGNAEIIWRQPALAPVDQNLYECSADASISSLACLYESSTTPQRLRC